MSSFSHDSLSRSAPQELFLHISQGLAGDTGEKFFHGLVEGLARALDVSYVFVGEYQATPPRVVTIAVFGDAQPRPNFEYRLAHTPCEQVLKRGVCSYPAGVQQAFPADHMLEAMGIESYAGTPLFDSQGEPMGILVALHRAPMVDTTLAEQLLRIFASRAAAELDRRRVEQALRDSEHRYRTLFNSAGDGIFLFRDGELVDCNTSAASVLGYTCRALVGKRLTDFSPQRQPDGSLSAEMEAAKSRAALTGVAQHFEWRCSHRSGRGVDMEFSLAPVEIRGQLHLLGTAHDITVRKQAEAAVRQSRCELEVRNEALQTINQLADRLHSSLDPKKLAQQAVEVLAKNTGSPCIAFYLLDSQRDRLQLTASHGFPAGTVRLGSTLPLEGSLSGIALREGRLTLCEDIAADARLEPAVQRALIRQGMRSAVLVPLITRGEPLGTVNVVYTAAHAFTTHELDMLRSVGATISLAISNALHFRELEHQAMHDGLTGLANRINFHAGVDRAIAEATGSDHVGLILVDLDRFKEINDTLGHRTGDRLLRLIGPRLRQRLRGQDALLARLGGDEFAVLLRAVDSVDVLHAVAVELRDALAEPFTIDGIKLELQGSIGLAAYPEHGHDSHSLLRCADVAMYDAKHHGKGLMVYDVEADAHTPQRLAMMTELGMAIREDQLVLHYQPQFGLADDSLVGYEALLRWQHPEHGLVPPSEFVPLAEMSELIRSLTLWVLDSALAQLCRWIAQGREVSVAVNLSARNLIDSSLPDVLAQLLLKHGIDGRHLELEITESAIIGDPQRALDVMQRIAALGIRFAVDDFGKGYSSLAYLKRLPIQTIKIDRSFISDMLSSEHDAIIVRSTISLAHGLGLKVVAEGVEDAMILQSLKVLRCDLAQGFHLGRPAPVSADSLSADS